MGCAPITPRNQAERARPAQCAAVIFDPFNTLTEPVRDSELRSSIAGMAVEVGADPDRFTQTWVETWRGETIETLGELPGLLANGAS